VNTFETLERELGDCEAFLELAEEEEDADAQEEAVTQLGTIEKELKQYSLTLMLSGEDDQNNAIISINAGAGGTEAQDWAEMLFRMYVRWVERKGDKMELI